MLGTVEIRQRRRTFKVKRKTTMSTQKKLYIGILVALGLLGWNLSRTVKAQAAVPVVVFDSAKVPNIVAHIRAAQAAGKPKILTRTTDSARIAANRKASGCDPSPYASPNSCDEYPFASTYEGGASATRASVPLTENQSQGGTLSSFYTANNIVDGSKFEVSTK
jgi:Deoxyribonuclease NucA/NucB